MQRRAHVLHLLLADGHTVRRIAAILFYSFDLIASVRQRYRQHGLCDNAIFHKSRRVLDLMAKQGGRIVLHFLPTRAPDENPVERVFWRLHEAITRNHRFVTIDELFDASIRWMEDEGTARVPNRRYNNAA